MFRALTSRIMHVSNIDAIDWRLLGALQDNAALTNAELAGRAGISASQVSRRRQRLEQDGLIRGYRALLDAGRLGLGVTVFVRVTLAAHSANNARRFADLVAVRPEILEAHSMTGDSDYLLKVALGDLKELARFVGDVLLPHASIDRVRSEIVLETLKEAAPLPLPSSSRPAPGRPGSAKTLPKPAGRTFA